MRKRYAVRWTRVPETLGLAASILGLIAVIARGG